MAREVEAAELPTEPAMHHVRLRLHFDSSTPIDEDYHHSTHRVTERAADGSTQGKQRRVRDSGVARSWLSYDWTLVARNDLLLKYFLSFLRVCGGTSGWFNLNTDAAQPVMVFKVDIGDDTRHVFMLASKTN
jgi:hypothetical protein